MNEWLAAHVRERAEFRCEYCGISEQYFAQRFQIEHIRAVSHGGSTTAENLALACMRCNLHKGPNLSGIDDKTDEIAPLFNPRRDSWPQHFEMTPSGEILGLTPGGRATVNTLNMNDPRRVQLRFAIGRLKSLK